jgi:transcriptional antiterminator
MNNLTDSELCKTLQALFLLSSEPKTIVELCDHFGVSRQTIIRRMSLAKHLGARIAMERTLDRTAPAYVILNWPEIAPRALRWMELEKEQTRIFQEAVSETGVYDE